MHMMQIHRRKRHPESVATSHHIGYAPESLAGAKILFAMLSPTKSWTIGGSDIF